MNINSHIKELLLLHDCVIIPGWGGFVAQGTPAMLDRDSRSITPPSKAISFNLQLKNNDGLLVNHISMKEACGYQEALDKVDTFVNHCKRLLESNGMVTFSGIGRVYKGDGDTINFVAERRSNFLLDSFGLKPITLPRKSVASTVDKVVEMPVAEPVTTKVEPENTTKERRAVREKRKGSKAITGISMLLAVLLLAGLMAIDQTPHNLQMHNLGIVNLEWNKPFNKVEEAPVAFKEAAIVNEPVNEAISEKSGPRLQDDEVHVLKDPVVRKGYYVVVASVSTLKLAEKHKAKLSTQGYDANIIHADNTPYRLGIFAGTDALEASDMLEDFRYNFNKDAWLVLNE